MIINFKGNMNVEAFRALRVRNKIFFKNIVAEKITRFSDKTFQTESDRVVLYVTFFLQ